MKQRDTDRAVHVAGRAKAFAAMDEKYAAAGKAGEAILNAYRAQEPVTAEAVGRLCASYHSTGLYAGCGKDTRGRVRGIYAAGKFDESKHKRDGGKFATQEGSDSPAQDGGGGNEVNHAREGMMTNLGDLIEGHAPGYEIRGVVLEEAKSAREALKEGNWWSAGHHLSQASNNAEYKSPAQQLLLKMSKLAHKTDKATKAQASAAGPVTTEHVRKRDE